MVTLSAILISVAIYYLAMLTIFFIWYNIDHEEFDFRDFFDLYWSTVTFR